MSNISVGIVMGSISDAEVMNEAKKVLDHFGITSDVRVSSAHRSPNETVAWVAQMEESGAKVLIAAAGMAAHLAGVVAAHTALPVLGVPMPGGALNGFDALLSTVQMPKGTPVGTFAIGKAGAINAALVAVRIMSLSDEALREKLLEYNKNLTAQVIDSNQELQKIIG